MSTSDSTITNDYNQLIAFSGYNPAQNYEAQFWQATHDSGNTLYQDLVSAAGPDFHTNAVPEPSSFVMGAGGLLFLVGIVTRRREAEGESRDGARGDEASFLQALTTVAR